MGLTKARRNSTDGPNLVDKLTLDLEGLLSPFLDDASNNIMCRFNGVEVTGKGGAFVENRLEEFAGESLLAFLPISP